MKVKVISILQPWASLVVLGHKHIETRSWNTKHRGEIYIHASQSNKGLKLLRNNKHSALRGFAEIIDMVDYEYPTGGIIGKVNLVSTIPSSTVNIIMCDGVSNDSGDSWLFTEQELAFGDFGPDRFG